MSSPIRPPAGPRPGIAPDSVLHAVLTRVAQQLVLQLEIVPESCRIDRDESPQKISLDPAGSNEATTALSPPARSDRG